MVRAFRCVPKELNWAPTKQLNTSIRKINLSNWKLSTLIKFRHALVVVLRTGWAHFWCPFSNVKIYFRYLTSCLLQKSFCCVDIFELWEPFPCPLLNVKSCRIVETSILGNNPWVGFKTPTFPRHFVYNRYCLDKDNQYMQKMLWVLFWMSYGMFVEAKSLRELDIEIKHI